MKYFLELLDYIKDKEINIGEIIFEQEENDSSVILSFVHNEQYYDISIYRDTVMIYSSGDVKELKIEGVIQYLNEIL